MVAVPVNAAQIAGVETARLLIFESLVVLAGCVSLWALWRADVIRPGSLARRGLRDTGDAPWWIWGLCAIAAYLLGGIGGGLAYTLLQQRPHTQLELMAAAMTAGGLASIAGAVSLLRSAGGGRWVEGVWPRIDRRGVKWGLLGLLAAYPVVQSVSILAVLLVILAGGDMPDPLAHETLKLLAESPGAPAAWVVIFAAVVLAPISEELIFRVFVQTMLLRLMRNGWAAVLITSVLFTLVHLGSGVPAEDAHALAPLFVLSVGMGVAYERTRRPLVPMVMHMGFNGINVLVAALISA